jgi:hypothetical protein
MRACSAFRIRRQQVEPVETQRRSRPKMHDAAQSNEEETENGAPVKARPHLEKKKLRKRGPSNDKVNIDEPLKKKKLT